MDFLRFLAEHRTPAGEMFFQFFTYFGQEVLIILILCLIYWCLNKKLAYQIGLTFFISGLAVQVLKIAFRIPRPWVLDPQFVPVSSAVSAATGYSFPSGHTQTATALFGTLALSLKKTWQRIVCVFLFAAVGFSRMYLGVHTPKDVGVSMLLTLLTAFVISRVCARLEAHPVSPAAVSAALALCSIFTAGFALAFLSAGAISSDYAADACKAAGAGLGFALAWYLEHTRVNFGNRVTLKKQAQKLFAGLLVTAALEFILKSIAGNGLFAGGLRYFVLVLWALCLFPLLDKKFSWGLFCFSSPQDSRSLT